MLIHLSELRSIIRETTDKRSIIDGWFEHHDDVLSAFDGWRVPSSYKTITFEELPRNDFEQLVYLVDIKLNDLRRERKKAEQQGIATDTIDFYIEGMEAASDDLRAAKETYSQSLDW